MPPDFNIIHDRHAAKRAGIEKLSAKPAPEATPVRATHPVPPPQGGGDANTGVSVLVSLPLAGRGQGWGYVSRTVSSTRRLDAA